jgi:signal peptidase I
VFGNIVYRPVDRRENYVKRCVAIAGDWIKIVDNKLFVNNNPQEHVPGLQLNYFVQTDGTQLTNEILEKLHISKEDRVMYDASQVAELAKFLGLKPNLPIYHFPLTEESLSMLKQITGVLSVKVEPSVPFSGEVFPLGGGKKWTRDNYGPLYIPKRGVVIKLNDYNLPIYERIIAVYEHNKLEVKNGLIYINGKQTDSYRFKMNYYWMMGDNRHNSADSRYWGFVPEDHIVGRPVVVWLSLDKDKGWFDGKIRWNRFMKSAER